MKIVPILSLLLGFSVLAMPQTLPPNSAEAAPCSPILSHKLPDIDGKTRSLCEFQGDVLLVVNTASFCGNTPQYKQLQALHTQYRKQGFSVLGFPANNFGKQEPGSNQDIKSFCEDKYDVSFPLFAKSPVIGKDANPFFKQLAAQTGKQPLWNFHKYLIDRSGKRVLSFSSSLQPNDRKLTRQIQAFLAQPE